MFVCMSRCIYTSLVHAWGHLNYKWLWKDCLEVEDNCALC